ncbi:MAG TPA: phosphatidylglycerol lysyltransferase domain-containing protein, partial [Dehalococcoidia bacterium]|nr:phosphatidylglycerol lysyltransferase domain-containing protein [Dehalococcoidia bacterium]
RDDARSPAAQATRLLYEWGSVFFRYKGLRHFKEKFHPVWEPRYLVYRSDLNLPALAIAIARAGELKHERPVAGRELPETLLAPA